MRPRSLDEFLRNAHVPFTPFRHAARGIRNRYERELWGLWTGQIRGVYMQGNEGARPVFEAWMQPFKDFGMTTLTMGNTGGTDHTNFDGVGLPGFQFIQDAIEYDTRTHHSNMDVYERLQTKDMMQNAVIVASFVYNAATRDGLFPRKALPQPQGQRGGRGQ